jgi:hypothetical protein
MYQELAQTTEQALEDLRRSTDEFSAKSQQDLAVKEVCQFVAVGIDSDFGP